MDFAVDTTKVLILIILIANLAYFFFKDFMKHKRTILMVLFLFSLCVGSLLNILSDYIDNYWITVGEHVIGVAIPGIIAMTIPILANLRMKKVMKREIRVVNN